MTTSTSLRKKLVDDLKKVRNLTTDEVARAFLSVPRELFVPRVLEEEGLDAVYVNNPIPLKKDDYGWPISSSSQPGIMALMLEALQISQGQSILEIGTGSGYNAALLETLVGPRGRVTSVEIEPDLA